MFEQKSNGAKWRELSGAVDAAAPQAMPTQPSEGRTSIAELVIADIRARAEAGERKYGTKLFAHNGRGALVDLYQELLDGAHYVRQEIEEREAARAMAPEGATAEVIVADRLRQAAEMESLKAGLRALANIRDEGAVETHRWRDRALEAERDAGRRTEEVAVRAARARAKQAEDHRDELSAEVQARGAELRAAKEERRVGDEAAALRGERDDLLVQLAAKTRETEAAQRERDEARTEISRLRALVSQVKSERGELADEVERAAGHAEDLVSLLWAQGEKLRATRRRAQAVEARAAALESERREHALRAARYKAMLNEDENDPATPCRCGQIQGACRSCLASALSEAEDVTRDVRAALHAAGLDTSELAPEELGGVVVEKLDDLAAKIDEVETLKAERARAEHEASRSDNALAEIKAAVTRHLEPLIDKEERGAAERVIIEAARILRRARDEVRKAALEWTMVVKRAEASRDDAHGVARQWERLARARDKQATPQLANEVRDGAPAPAQVAPVEAPQATERPDPGEGWRLLGPEEVIEWGDEFWSPSLDAWGHVGSLYGAPARWWSPGRGAVRRRITTPVAPAPVVEPVTEVVEARGSKFVIVRREVAT